MARNKKRSLVATLWFIAALVFVGIFAVDYWLQADATPVYSFLYGTVSGGCAVLAQGARRKARRREGRT